MTSEAFLMWHKNAWMGRFPQTIEIIISPWEFTSLEYHRPERREENHKNTILNRLQEFAERLEE